MAGKAKEGVGEALPSFSVSLSPVADQAKSSLKDAGEKVKDAFKK